MSTFFTVQHNFSSPLTSFNHEKEIKGIQIRKDAICSLYADDVIICIEYIKDSLLRNIKPFFACDRIVFPALFVKEIFLAPLHFFPSYIKD